jgi:hypothetical protein
MYKEPGNFYYIIEGLLDTHDTADIHLMRIVILMRWWIAQIEKGRLISKPAFSNHVERCLFHNSRYNGSDNSAIPLAALCRFIGGNGL